MSQNGSTSTITITALTAPPPAAGETAGSANQTVIEAILGHHAHLQEVLQARTDAVVSAGRTGACQVERDALQAWYDDEIVPHAGAEEQTLYDAAAELDTTRLLVSAMVAEHRSLVQLVASLATAVDPVDIISAAVAAQAVFSVHLSKENDLLLPALDRAGTDLAALLGGMQKVLGDQDAQREQPNEIDVRSLPHGHRHDVIFARLEELALGDLLLLVNDHDPKPLRYQISALWPDRFEWTYRQSGPELWQIAINRVQ